MAFDRRQRYGSPNMKSVAIIGAGMAGAAAARALSAAGLRVALFDKGRGIGGRMATRRFPDGSSVDHGAQYFSARDAGFAALVAEWTTAGVAAPWGSAGWSVGTPAMTSPVRAMLAGLDVTTGCTVARLARDGQGWRLSDATGHTLADRLEAVLVTAPAPQARDLVATAGVTWPALKPALDGVRYAPCWTLMLEHRGDPVFAETQRRERDPDAAIAWIARDGTKPGRDPACETLVVNAAPGWSRTHLERAPDEVAALLMTELRRALGPGTPAGDRVVRAVAHRWRYAMVETAMDTPCLWSPELGLGIAGDGCLGGRVEAAYLSGTALAAQVLAR